MRVTARYYSIREGTRWCKHGHDTSLTGRYLSNDACCACTKVRGKARYYGELGVPKADRSALQYLSARELLALAQRLEQGPIEPIEAEIKVRRSKHYVRTLGASCRTAVLCFIEWCEATALAHWSRERGDLAEYNVRLATADARKKTLAAMAMNEPKGKP